MSLEFAHRLCLYYENFFPAQEIFQALEICSSVRFREFAVTMSNGCFKRFISCKNLEQLQKMIKCMQPQKLHIGGSYNIPMIERPARPTAENFHCIAKELVFDIDMTDYPATMITNRTDPSDASFQKSWRFMYMASMICKIILEEDFGMQNMLFVFSGRRGIHIWVNDKRALKLPAGARSAIVNYMSVFDAEGKVQRSAMTYPSLQRIGKWITGTGFEVFLTMAEEQRWLYPERLDETIFAVIHDANLQKLIRDQMLRCRLKAKYGDVLPCEQAMEAWQALLDILYKPEKSDSLRYQTRRTQSERFRKITDELVLSIILHLVFPRFDRNVTTGMNHLIKAPFSVHPLTERICVPFDPVKAMEFEDIGAVTMTQLFDSLSSNNGSAAARGPLASCTPLPRNPLIRQILIMKRALIWPSHATYVCTPDKRLWTNRKAIAAAKEKKDTHDW